MRIDRIKLHYQLEFQSDFHCGTGLRIGLLHRAIARDGNNFLYIPGSTLKGVLRDHATHIARFLGLVAPNQHAGGAELAHVISTNNIITLLFGSNFQPGTLFFDDALLCKEQREFYYPPQKEQEDQKHFLAQQIETRTQVSMSRVTGTAHSGMLFSSEYGTKGMRFEGNIYGILSGVPVPENPSISYSLVLLFAALNNLERIGGGKSSGFGQVTYIPTYLRINDLEYQENISVQKKIDECLDLLSEFDYYDIALEEEELC